MRFYIYCVDGGRSVARARCVRSGCVFLGAGSENFGPPLTSNARRSLPSMDKNNHSTGGGHILSYHSTSSTLRGKCSNLRFGFSVISEVKVLTNVIAPPGYILLVGAWNQVFFVCVVLDTSFASDRFFFLFWFLSLIEA